MARGAALALALLALLGAAVLAQDLDLADALGDKELKKPVPTPKKPTGDGFNLEDAFEDVPPPSPPKRKPQPGQPENTGGFSDSDLVDGNSGGTGDGHGGGGGSPRSDGEQGTPQGLVPGVVGAVLAALAGAVSSFIAYQKKKLCFKGNVEQGEVDLANRPSTNAEPPGAQDFQHDFDLADALDDPEPTKKPGSDLYPKLPQPLDPNSGGSIYPPPRPQPGGDDAQSPNPSETSPETLSFSWGSWVLPGCWVLGPPRTACFWGAFCGFWERGRTESHRCCVSAAGHSNDVDNPHPARPRPPAGGGAGGGHGFSSHGNTHGGDGQSTQGSPEGNTVARIVSPVVSVLVVALVGAGVSYFKSNRGGSCLRGAAADAEAV